MNVKKGLESLVTDYAPIIGITALETPLHEGMHAGLAKLLPHVGCTGIELAPRWYNPILSALSLGFYKTGELPAGIAGQAMITTQQDLIGHLSSAVVSAGPEIAAMTLGFFWIKRAMANIRESGERTYALVNGLCGMAFASSTYYYLKSSVTSPVDGSDYKGFTQSLLQTAHLPGMLAPALTAAGAAIMLGSALYLADKIPGAGKKERGFFSSLHKKSAVGA